MSITNAGRVKEVLSDFSKKGAYLDLCEDAPFLYTESNLKNVRELKQYGKGALSAMASAVEQRAEDVLSGLLEHSGERGLVNDKLLDKVVLYNYPTES